MNSRPSKAKASRDVKAEFLRTTKILPRHAVNRLDDRLIRGSPLFNFLAERIFDYPGLLKILTKKIKGWLSQDDSDFTVTLAGFIFYLNEDYRKAEGFFLKSLNRDPRNLDTWFDLAFSLYHQGEKKQKLATQIIFNFDACPRKFGHKKIGLDVIAAGLRMK